LIDERELVVLETPLVVADDFEEEAQSQMSLVGALKVGAHVEKLLECSHRPGNVMRKTHKNE
jgi:hypothetical protein